MGELIHGEIGSVLVTGAGRGIGLEVVKAFLKTTNHPVIAITRNPMELIKIENDNLKIIHGDILVKYQETLNQIYSAQTKLAIIINNAAMAINKSITDVSDEDIKATMDLNFSLPYRLIRDLLPIMAPGTHIVNISSMSGYQGSKKFKGLSLYSASKSALAALSECIAEEWSEKKIYCNCLALGAVQTDMIKVTIPGLMPSVSAQDMGLYICDFSKTGSKYFNGQIIPVTQTTF
jgi:NAD(P)-dependent dehydrogenase (short-subunit alcohol dehydrogenase family)